MKTPDELLPLSRSKEQMYGQYSIFRRDKVNDPETNDWIEVQKYCGQIASKELSQYVVTAANNFPEMLKLLEYCVDIFNELDAVEWHEESSFQTSSYDGVKYDIEELLEKIEDEHNKLTS